MLTILAGIAILGFLVFVHELGHFTVAKLAGVKVLKFSIGFGPRLLSRQWGETEYMICVIPLGGYVLMLGEGGTIEGDGEVETPEDASRSFAAKPVGIRSLIIAAGPLTNLVLPFLILPLAFMLGVSVPAYIEQPATTGYVVAGSPAAAAGFQANDRIVAINNSPVTTWESVNNILLSHAGTTLEIEVQRAQEQLVLSLSDGGIDGLMAVGLLPPQEAVVGTLAAGMPADAAGLKVGDRILAIDGQSVKSWYDLKDLIRTGAGSGQSFKVQRADGTLTTLTMTAQAKDGEYIIGISPQMKTIEKRYAPLAAIGAGWNRANELIELTYLFIGKLFTGHVSSDNIGGPISVVQIAGQAAQTDVASIFLILAFLSIQLGILNLLPIPILDGGHLFFNLIEVIIRRPLSLRIREIAQQVGLALLLLLMLLAFYNDITRLVMGG
ncbi:MAG: RIP metalloprotease RseP [Deltaproteobacteria bacterium HGW-Deltaproteobacteria-4]|nr:MAG: RIP metalloprotease RseP [Deltaproteobacteria bacterium HGW-Deltaproteobacteria-4]